MKTQQRSVWPAWATLVISSFAILESRAIKSNRTSPTLSHVVACSTRKTCIRKIASTTLILGSAAWLAYHFNFEGRLEDGTFKSFVVLSSILSHH